MTLVSVYLADTERLYETCEAIDRSKEQFNKDPSVSSGNSSISGIVASINNLAKEIEKDYETTSKTLRNYTNKVEANENNLKSKAISLLENDSVVKNIPVMVTDSNTSANYNKEIIEKNTEDLKKTNDDIVDQEILKDINIFVQAALLTGEMDLEEYAKKHNIDPKVLKATIESPESIEKINEQSLKFKELQNEIESKQEYEEKVGDIFTSSMLDSLSPFQKLTQAATTYKSIKSLIGLAGEGISKIKNKKETKTESKNNEKIVEITNKITSMYLNEMGAIGYIYSGAKSLITGEEYSDVLEETKEQTKDIKTKLLEVKKSTNALSADALISLTQGVLNFGEEGVKTLELLSTADEMVSDGYKSILKIITNKDSLKEFEERNIERWNKVGAFVSTEHIESLYDKFYDETDFGKMIKENAPYHEQVREISSGIGYLGASLFTGSIASGAITEGVALAPKVVNIIRSLTNAFVYGSARFGGATGDAINDGATMDEALLYGGATGVKEASGMFIGNIIQGWNPFHTGKPLKIIGNSLLHVGLDTLDGAASALIDPILQSLYTPSEESLEARGYKLGVDSYKNLSLDEKYVENFNANGGWSNIIGTAVFSGAMSLLSEIPDMTKNIIGYNKGTALYDEIAKTRKGIQEAATEEELDTLTDKLNDLYKKYGNLGESSKYYFDLEKIKQEINVGNITSESLNFLLDSNNTKEIFNSLTNEEKLLLLDSISKSEQDKIFESLGKTGTNLFKRKNKEYFSDASNNTTTDTSSKIKFQFFIEPKSDSTDMKETLTTIEDSTDMKETLTAIEDSTDMKETLTAIEDLTDMKETLTTIEDSTDMKESLTTIEDLSSQGKITKEYVASLTEDQYKVILLQADENPKLVSDVISMIDSNAQVQQVINVIKNMNGDELATVMDVDGLDMGFITRNAINNLDESQVTETLIKKIASLDDDKFIEFVHKNANSALYNNQEIFDRAIATATKEQIDFISSFDGVHIWNFSDEVQFKILSNKEYVTQIIGNDPFQISETMRKVSLDSSKALLNNIDTDALDFNAKMKIARSLSNCDNVEIQNLFFEQSKLLFDGELKAMSVSDTIKFIYDIKSSSIKQKFIEQCGILNKSGQLSGSELLGLIRNISDEDIRFNLIIDPKNQESLDYFIGDVGILLGPDKFEKFYKYLDSDKKMLLVNDITLENKEFVTEIKKLINSDPTLIEKIPQGSLKSYFAQMNEVERTVLLSKMTPKMSIDVYSSDILNDGEKLIVKNNLFNQVINTDDDSLALKFFKLLDDSEQKQFLDMKSGIDNNHLKQYIESTKNDTLKEKIFELVTIGSDEDLSRLRSDVTRLTPHDLKLFEQSINDKTFILYSAVYDVDSLEENVMQRFKKNHGLFGNYGSEKLIEKISDSAREEIFKVVKEEGNEILEKTNLTKIVNSDFFDVKNYSKIIEMEQLGYLSKVNCDMLLNMYEKNPCFLKTFNVGLMNPEISNIGELFIEKMSRYPSEALRIVSLQQSNPEKFATFKLLANELANDDSLSIYNEKLARLLKYFEENNNIISINPANANNYIDYIMSEYSLFEPDTCMFFDNSKYMITDRITLGHYSEDYQREFSEHLDNLFKNATTVEEKKNVLMTKLFGLSNQETEVFLKTYYDNLSLEDIEQCRKLLGNETMDFILNVYNVSKIDSSEIIENLYNSSQGNKQELIKVIGDLKKVYAKTYNDALEKTATLIRSEMANCTTIKALGEFSFDNFSGSCMINVNGKLIPVIEAPDEFSFMAHSTGAYGSMGILNDSYSDSWNYSERTTNHGICCSYITDSKIETAEVSGKGVLFGFSGFSDESIQRMAPYDIYSINDDINSKSLMMPLFVPAKDISSETVNVYNEFVIERTELRNGINNGFNNIQPNYVFVLEEWNDDLKQNAIKAASDFEPPLQVVYISRNKVAANAVKKIDTDLSSFASTHDLTYFENALNTHESTRTSFWHSQSIVDYDETFPTSKITSSIDAYLAHVKSSYDGVPESGSLYINELERFKTIIQKEQTRFDDGSFHAESRTSFDLNSTEIIQQIDDMIQYIKGEN